MVAVMISLLIFSSLVILMTKTAPIFGPSMTFSYEMSEISNYPQKSGAEHRMNEDYLGKQCHNKFAVRIRTLAPNRENLFLQITATGVYLSKNEQNPEGIFKMLILVLLVISEFSEIKK